MIFLPKAVILDFKMASNDGFRKIFIDIDVKLCRFHWAQAAKNEETKTQKQKCVEICL